LFYKKKVWWIVTLHITRKNILGYYGTNLILVTEGGSGSGIPL